MQVTAAARIWSLVWVWELPYAMSTTIEFKKKKEKEKEKIGGQMYEKLVFPAIQVLIIK